MIAGLIGTIIASMATASLLIAIRIGDATIKNAGKYPLTSSEKAILINAGYEKKDLQNIQLDLNELPTK